MYWCRYPYSYPHSSRVIQRQYELYNWQQLQQFRTLQGQTTWREEAISWAHDYLALHPQSDEIPVTPSLVEICPIPIHQFIVTRQLGDTCGNHALFNALAVQELVKSERELSAENVRRLSSELLSQHQIGECTYELFEEDITKLGEAFLITDTRIVALDPTTGNYYTTVEIDQGTSYFPHSDERLQRLEQFYTKILGSNAMLATFILNAGGHWVTVSIIKFHQSLDIIYMNSLNTPLYEGSYAYQFIANLCRKLRPH